MKHIIKSTLPGLCCAVFLVALTTGYTYSQISPGDLSSPHSSLEGITNCTKCHEIGNKITGEKCLNCHTEIRDRINAGRGYHSSSEVKAKKCIQCHSEHHGKNFQLVRLNTADFNHVLTGFSLSAPHAKLQCADCHAAKFIGEQKIKEKKFTYLGLKQECLNCHADYHLSTLSPSCLNCHGDASFKTAPRFSHNDARFKLIGRHKSVECINCHRIETINGNKFQEFRGVQFASCVNCHKDPHQNKFGQDCKRCHNEESFTIIKGIASFDHNKTEFPLEGQHLTVDCNKCHKTKFTDPLKHDNCTDCHADYHKGQFAKGGKVTDCSTCHSVAGFDQFSYTLEQHNSSKFPLKGAHAAQPCIQCHKKQAEWSFRNIGINCRDCHTDIHKDFIDIKFYPDENCRVCHNESDWYAVTYDHSGTGFLLTGAHAGVACATCHITRKSGKITDQKFMGLQSNCSACHSDIHQGQFNEDGKEVCIKCHQTKDWIPSSFDHSKTAFPLDGQHKNVPCDKCHKPQTNGTSSFTLFKIKDYRCESCHL